MKPERSVVLLVFGGGAGVGGFGVVNRSLNIGNTGGYTNPTHVLRQKGCPEALKSKGFWSNEENQL